MSGGLVAGPVAPSIGQQVIERIESHCVLAWPAQVIEHTDDGWVLRATPGLRGRGRSNHALAPPWPLTAAEINLALERVGQFAAQHGIECGIQAGPLEVHLPLLDEVAARGWEIQPSVLVMTGATDAIVAGEPTSNEGGTDSDSDSDSDGEFVLEITDHVTPAWMAAWELCEPSRDNTRAHLDTVFALMEGSASFARAGERAVGIAVEHDGIIGLFCLAVNPEERRQGLGRKLVRGLLAGSSASLAYLQVFSGNAPAVGLYGRLGFVESYRYCHCVAPPPRA